MSEEMNLYKRCKNIFKAHGVDMGGGGSGGGELDIIIDISNSDSPVLIKGNYEAIAAKIGHDTITGLVTFTIEAEGEIGHYSSSILSAVHAKTSTEELIEFVFWLNSNMLGLKFYPDGTIEIAM